MRKRLSLRKTAKQPIRLFKRCLWLLLGVCLVLGLNVLLGDRGWSLPSAFVSAPAIGSVPASQLVQQGVEAYQTGAYQAAIDRWQAALAIYQQQQDWAKATVVLENLARAQSQIGQTSQAIQVWQQVIELYRQQDNQRLGRALTEQAQLYSRQGQSRQAIALLCGEVRIAQCNPDSAVQLARQTDDRMGEAAALGSLGKAYRLRGDFSQAIQFLTAALHLADQIGSKQYRAAAFSDLGQAHLALAKVDYQRSIAATQAGETQEADRLRQAGQQQDQQAIGYLNQSLAAAEAEGNRLDQMQALLNLLSIYRRTPNTAEQNSIQQQARTLLETLPDSQEKAYAAIDLARLLRSAASSPPGSIVPETALSTAAFAVTGCYDAAPEVRALLQQAIAVAQQIGDSRSQSFALGELGHFYECQQNDQQAIALTQQARWTAEQNLQAKDSLYQWEWQSGRILKAQGKPIEAIQMYEKAVATLNDIRSDLLIANRDLQFDFRDAVDPVYRDLIALRLELEQTNASIESVNLPRDDRQNNNQNDNRNNSDIGNENINAALETLDALRLAELQNYFGDDCAVLAAADTSENRSAIDANAAIFSSVILDDRTALIVTFPDGSQQLHWIETDRNTLIRSVNQYRISLESFFEPFNVQFAQQLYRWIMAPFENTLAQAQIKTLVFVQDGILRSVPMAALHDGQQFLIQKYAIATTPSLSLTSISSLNRNRLRALAVGLTDAVQIGNQVFPPLSYVSQEIQAIEAALPGSKPLLNQDFTRDRIQQELTRSTFPILHLSTHGEFGFDPESTFLVTGDRQKLSLPALEALIRSPRGTVELLTLTACETAVGDDRAALGLAGIAVQAGVESALASLWFVDDAATAQLAVQFYGSLRNPSLSKAEALQAAQLSLIEAGTANREPLHPAFWAAFILIGNWR